MDFYNKPPPQQFLMHHGIKGQKWGVRRFQNKDGTLTGAGKKRYGGDGGEKKSSAGKKVAVAIGTAAVVAVGAHFAKKYYQMNADAVIKKGREFQHMGRIGEDLLKPFYASYLKKDNKFYAKNDFFGSNWKTQKTLVADKDIKIAGKKATMKTFIEWVNTSPLAKEAFAGLDTSRKSDVRRSYYRFNKNLRSPDMRDKRLFNDFYSAMMEKGYDAIRDMNDQHQSKTISPVIIFGSLEKIMTTKIKDL